MHSSDINLGNVGPTTGVQGRGEGEWGGVIWFTLFAVNVIACIPFKGVIACIPFKGIIACIPFKGIIACIPFKGVIACIPFKGVIACIPFKGVIACIPFKGVIACIPFKGDYQYIRNPCFQNALTLFFFKVYMYNKAY